MNRRNLLKKLKNKVQEDNLFENNSLGDENENLKTENQQLKTENQHLKERIENYDRHYSEIINQLNEGFYDRISDKILQRQNEILRNKLLKYENARNNNENFILLAKVTNTCCKMLQTKKQNT